jgi:hypothetical protein
MKVHKRRDFDIVFFELDSLWRRARWHICPAANCRGEEQLTTQGTAAAPEGGPAEQEGGAGQTCGRARNSGSYLQSCHCRKTLRHPSLSAMFFQWYPFLGNLRSSLFLGSHTFTPLPWQALLDTPLLGSCTLTSFPWQPLLGALPGQPFAWQPFLDTLLFDSRSWAPFLGNLLLGTSSLAPLLGNLSLGPFPKALFSLAPLLWFLILFPSLTVQCTRTGYYESVLINRDYKIHRRHTIKANFFVEMRLRVEVS